MQVTEIFKSIQGESTYVGLPCTFIRLTACNLRCDWCDTEYAFAGGRPMTVDEVMEQVHSYGGKLVEVTGGEPLLQQEVYALMDRLLSEGFQVMLETSGERKIGRVPREVVKIVDVKCPDSGAADTFEMENLDYFVPHDQVKFVIATRRDYEFARDFALRHGLPERLDAVMFSPAHERVSLQEIAHWILDDRLEGVRFGYQLHKVIWGADARGV